MKDYTINLDWLELMLAKDNYNDFENRAGFEFSSVGKPMDVFGFNKYIKISYKNQAFARLYFDKTDRMRYFDKRCSVLQINNEALYRSEALTHELKEFLKVFNFEFNYIRELHIAIDGEGILKRHNELFLDEKNMARVAKLDFTYGGHDKYYGKSQLTIGSRNSDKFIRFYDKSKEIKSSRKIYIEQFWANNNLKGKENSVDRMELVLKRRELNKLNIEMEQLETPFYLSSLFGQCTKGYLEFKNIKTKEIEKVVDLGMIEDYTFVKENKITFKEISASIKTTIKILFLESIKNTSPEDLARAESLAIDYNLLSWFNNKKKRWLKENALFGLSKVN